jgi:hypothetical protein
MPKIGKHFTKIHADDIEQNIEYFVHYNTNYGFYVLIPEQFNDGFDLLTDDEKKELSAIELRRGKYKNGDAFGRAAYAESETKLHDIFKELIRLLISRSIKTRPVIVIWHESEKDGSRPDSKAEFPKVGTSLQFTYCTELQAGTSQPHYYLYWKTDFNGRDNEVRKEIKAEPSWRNNNVLVIDDTKENRQALEVIYKALNELDSRLKEITKTPANLLDFIASKQLLLGGKEINK